MDTLKPMKAERGLMKATGSNIMGQSAQRLQRASAATIGHAGESQRSRPDPYGSVSINDMIQTTAKAQFDGVCV